MKINRVPVWAAGGVLAAVLAGMLAACVSQSSSLARAEPPIGAVPSSSGAAACTPATATIAWQPKTQVDDARLGTFVQTVSADRVIETRRVPDHPAPQYSPDTLTLLTGFKPSAMTAWEKALLDSVRLTGQVSRTFGSTTAMPATNVVNVPDSAVGTFVTDVGLNQFQVPFTIECSGSKPVEGWIEGAEVGGTASTIIQCGVAPKHVSAGTDRAEKFCPKA